MMDSEPSNWMKPHVTSWRAARHANADHVSMGGLGWPGGRGGARTADTSDGYRQGRADANWSGKKNKNKKIKNCWEKGRLLITTLKLAGCAKGPRTVRLWVYLVCDAPP